VFVDLKLLSDHRDQLVRARTRLINRTHTDLVISHSGYEKRTPKLNSKKNQGAALTLLRPDRSVRAGLIQERIGEIRRLSKKVADVEKQIAGKVKESSTTLTALQGIGFVLAAKILGEVGDPARIRSKGAFRHADRDRADRGSVREDQAASPQPRRQPSAQLRRAHDGSSPSPAPCRHEGLRCTSPDGG
jgi:transposase